MIESVKVLASRIRSQVPRSIYNHCLCHRLNLSLQTACAEILEVRNCGTVNSLFNFINGSAKRLQIFRYTQSGTNGTTLKQHCETRWSSRKNSIKSLAQNYEFILETLHFIQETDKTPAGSNSTSLLKASKDFEFLFVLQVLYLAFERTGMFSDVWKNIRKMQENSGRKWYRWAKTA